MKHFIDANNEVFAFEEDGSQDAYIHEGLAPITDEQLAALRAPSQGQMKAQALARINASYQQKINELTAEYPEREIESWAKQESEARAYVLDNLTPTPWVDAAAAARNIPKDEFITRIIAKADAFAPVHGHYTGIRQMLEDQINALVDGIQTQYDAIQWPE